MQMLKGARELMAGEEMFNLLTFFYHAASKSFNILYGHKNNKLR